MTGYSEVQSHVITGYRDQNVAAFVCAIADAGVFRRWLQRTGSEMKGSRQWILEGARQTHTLKADAQARRRAFTIGFSVTGLRKLHPATAAVTASDFQDGFYERFIRFVAGAYSPNAAEILTRDWVIGRLSNEIHAIIIIGADEAGELDRFRDFDLRTDQSGLVVTCFDVGRVRYPGAVPREAFGFRDGISNPNLRGTLSAARLRERVRGESHQTDHPIKVGEFILGYPREDDNGLSTPDENSVPNELKNGTYLVYLRYEQNSELFWSAVRRAENDLQTRHAELRRLASGFLAAKIVGRWPSGAPVYLYPERDPALDQEAQELLNAFSHGLDDPDGIGCPFSAHIRKTNPRNDLRRFDNSHRILRRGFRIIGKTQGRRSPEGLAFLCYQTSIERQFEHIFFTWANDPEFPRTGSMKDVLIGVENGSERRFYFPLRKDSGTAVRVMATLPSDIVRLTGGAYFFVPSVSALKNL